jgi:YHS domain-containing protein
MQNKYPALKLFILSFVALGLFLTGSSIADENSNEASTSLTEVEGKNVCMVNDQLFVKDQIPVEYEGKTYYGCCEMCKATIKNNPESRVGTDPVSGNKVDKSVAVIGAASDGSIYYFESEENLKKYNTPAKN